MELDSCVLTGDDASPLRLTFHRTARVGDHEDPSRQTVATAVEHSPPCRLTRWPHDGDEPTYLLALDCPAGRALAELDAFGIRAWTGRPTEEGIKLEIKVEGENVAFPPLPRWEQSPAPAERRQDYFFLSSTGSETDEEWIHGIAVKEEPRLVRQFVVRNDGTGASIQQQVTGEAVPEKMGIVEIEVTVAPRSSEVVGSSTASSVESPSGNSLAAVSRTVPTGSRPVSPAPAPAQIQSDTSSSLGEPPCNTTPTGARPPRATPSPRSPSLSERLQTSVHPSPTVEEYHLFVRLDRSFTIRQGDGTITVKDVVEPLRVDNVSFSDIPGFLKHLVAESLRWDLAIGPGATVTTGSNDNDALAIDSFDLVYDGRILDNSRYLEDYDVYPGCTLKMVYRTPAAYPVAMESTVDYSPSDTALKPVFDDGDISTPALSAEPKILDPRRHRRLREETVREHYVEYAFANRSDWQYKAELRHEIDREVEIEYDLYRKVKTEYEPEPGTLEILPGGLIAQPLSKDPGTYDWASRQKSKLKVRIVNFEQFRSLTGQEPPEPPQLPGGARLPRRDARNPEGTDSMLASNAEHQFQHQPSPNEFGTSSTTSGSRKSTFSGKDGARKPNEGAAGVLQNLAVLRPVSEKPSKTEATSPPSDGAASCGVPNMTSNDTSGHTASTEGSSGGRRPKHPPSEATTGKSEVSGTRERGGNEKAETTSGSCSCCTCM